MRGVRLTRRGFLRVSAGAVALVGVPTMSVARPTLLQRALPRGGERLPALGLGTYRAFDIGGAPPAERTAAREVLRRFVAAGGRVVDSSPMYDTAEASIGELAAELGVADRLFLATKVWTRGRREGVEQMETSIKRLRTRRIDLLQVHNLVDTDTHLATLREWKQAGRVRYVGVTHYHAGAHDDLARVLAATPDLDFVQLNYSVAEREAERRLLPLARERGVAVLVNRPFAQADLFARVRGRPLPPVAADLGCTSWAQLFLKFILAHPAVTCVIPATRDPRHLDDNLAAAAATARLPNDAERARILAALD